MTTATETALDPTRFARAAELIRTKGFWQAINGEEAHGRICAGLALLDAKHDVAEPIGQNDDPFYAEINHLARQLGYDQPSNGNTLSFLFGWNDSTPEGEVLDVLDKLARGESLV